MSKFITPNSREVIYAYDPIAQEAFSVEGTSSDGAINVNVAGSAGTLDSNLTEIDGNPVSVDSGNADIGTQRVVIASDQSAIPASQSGTWNINNISGTVSLPTGASTAANQTTANGLLTDISTDTGDIVSNTATPTSVYTGQTNVTTAGTRVVLGSSQAVKSVVIKAKTTNTGLIYVGGSSVTSSNGFILSAGDTVSIDISNINTVNIDSSVNAEGVSWLGSN